MISETFNIYCDEFCHLKNDGQKAIVLGAVWCPEGERLEFAQRLRLAQYAVETLRCCAGSNSAD